MPTGVEVSAFGMTCLMHDFVPIDHMIRLGADFNKSQDGKHCLHMVSGKLKLNDEHLSCRLRILSCLLEVGVDPNVLSPPFGHLAGNRTALHDAAMAGSFYFLGCLMMTHTFISFYVFFNTEPKTSPNVNIKFNPKKTFLTSSTMFDFKISIKIQ